MRAGNARDPDRIDPRMRTLCVMICCDDDSEEGSVDEAIQTLVEFTPGVETIKPGLYLIPTLGPSRYHGGERALATSIHTRLVQAMGVASTSGNSSGPAVSAEMADMFIGVSVAGGPRMAVIAASEMIRLQMLCTGASHPSDAASSRVSSSQVPSSQVVGTDLAGTDVASSQVPIHVATHQSVGVVVIKEGTDAAFLAPLPIQRLEHLLDPPVIDLFIQLGLVTIGRFAQLRRSDVLDRFGPSVADVHHLANGCEYSPSSPTVPEQPLVFQRTFEPPLEQVDQVAFVARAMAQDLMELLDSEALTADRIVIVLCTDDGEKVERAWRMDRGLSAQAVTQRVRWQIEGWLRHIRGRSSRQGQDRVVDRRMLSSIEIRPEDIRPLRGSQLSLWETGTLEGAGGNREHDWEVRNGIDRIRGLFGADSVKVPRIRGGRSPLDAYHMVDIDSVGMGGTSGTSTTTRPNPADGEGAVVEPWPGSIPAPSPSRVWKDPLPAVVYDRSGSPVGVSGRGTINSPPAAVSIEGGPWMNVKAWSGPWCVDERWWDPLRHRRKARLQVVLGPSDSTDVSVEASSAHLLSLEGGRWWVEATYD